MIIYDTLLNKLNLTIEANREKYEYEITVSNEICELLRKSMHDKVINRIITFRKKYSQYNNDIYFREVLYIYNAINSYVELNSIEFDIDHLIGIYPALNDSLQQLVTYLLASKLSNETISEQKTSEIFALFKKQKSISYFILPFINTLVNEGYYYDAYSYSLDVYNTQNQFGLYNEDIDLLVILNVLATMIKKQDCALWESRISDFISNNTLSKELLANTYFNLGVGAYRNKDYTSAKQYFIECINQNDAWYVQSLLLLYDISTINNEDFIFEKELKAIHAPIDKTSQYFINYYFKKINNESYTELEEYIYNTPKKIQNCDFISMVYS